MVQQLWIFMTREGNWSTGPRLAGGGRGAISAVTLDHKALFAGGIFGGLGSASDAVNIYDSRVDQWSLGPPLAGGARGDIYAIAIGN